MSAVEPGRRRAVPSEVLLDCLGQGPALNLCWVGRQVRPGAFERLRIGRELPTDLTGRGACTRAGAFLLQTAASGKDVHQGAREMAGRRRRRACARMGAVRFSPGARHFTTPHFLQGMATGQARGPSPSIWSGGGVRAGVLGVGGSHPPSRLERRLLFAVAAGVLAGAIPPHNPDEKAQATHHPQAASIDRSTLPSHPPARHRRKPVRSLLRRRCQREPASQVAGRVPRAEETSRGEGFGAAPHGEKSGRIHNPNAPSNSGPSAAAISVGWLVMRPIGRLGWMG